MTAAAQPFEEVRTPKAYEKNVMALCLFLA